MTKRLVSDLHTEITRHGQRFYDKPVYKLVSKAKPMALAIAAVAGSELSDIFGITHYERTPLKWVK